MLNINAKSKFICAMIMIGLGVTGRFLLVTYAGNQNFEIITALALVAGMYVGGVYAVIVPVSIVFLSDIVIGNNYIFIFTWTAFAIIGASGALFKGKADSIKLFGSLLLAIASSTFFYLYTNFGWWLMSGTYEYSIQGLIRCYTMAIPFFKNQLIGNMVSVPVAIYFGKYALRSIDMKTISASEIGLKLKNNHF